MPVVTKFPSANQAAGAPFNGSWTNPNNAHADDGTYSTAAPGKNQEFASVWNVPFSTSDIPNGAMVNSVTVEVQWKVSTTSSVATLRSTAFADSAQTTAVSASPGINDTAEPTSDTIRTYAATPTLAQLRDLWIRVQAMRGNSNTAVTASLDYVKVAVDYTDPPASVTGTGAGTSAASSSSGAGTEAFRATGTGIGVSSSGDGSGTVTAGGISGTGSGTSAASSSDGTALLQYLGTLAGTDAASTATGQAKLLFAAAGTGTDALSTAEGVGLLRFLATGAGTDTASSGAGTGAIGGATVGSGAGTSAASSGEGTGAVTYIFTAAGAGTSVASSGSGTGMVQDLPTAPNEPGHATIGASLINRAVVGVSGGTVTTSVEVL